MTSIDRTAYPLFKRNPTADELNHVYSPTDIEVAFTYKQTRDPARSLSFMLLLKGFQRLGYFPAVADIPAAIMRPSVPMILATNSLRGVE